MTRFETRGHTVKSPDRPLDERPRPQKHEYDVGYAEGFENGYAEGERAAGDFGRLLRASVVSILKAAPQGESDSVRRALIDAVRTFDAAVGG